MTNVNETVEPTHTTQTTGPQNYIILESISKAQEVILDYDILMIAQKIVSKSEGQIIDLNKITP